MSLIRAAQQDPSGRLGQLLTMYANYLRMLANSQLDDKLKARVSASDLVQDTLMEAHRDFPQFRGGCEREFVAWLRQILVNNLRRQVEKHVQTEKRDIRREISIEAIGAAMDRSTVNMRVMLQDGGPTPSAETMQRENAVVLADYLARMPDEYRQVLMLRNLQGLGFAEVAQQMDRSAGAVRMLWVRAIRHLRQMMNDPTEN